MPEEGIYTQRDPIGLAGGNPTLYGYVHNTLSELDPFGLARWQPGDAVDALIGPKNRAPSWSTVRRRYWRNAGHSRSLPPSASTSRSNVGLSTPADITFRTLMLLV